MMEQDFVIAMARKKKKKNIEKGISVNAILKAHIRRVSGGYPPADQRI
jgi:hypothetical protein